MGRYRSLVVGSLALVPALVGCAGTSPRWMGRSSDDGGTPPAVVRSEGRSGAAAVPEHASAPSGPRVASRAFAATGEVGQRLVRYFPLMNRSHETPGSEWLRPAGVDVWAESRREAEQAKLAPRRPSREEAEPSPAASPAVPDSVLPVALHIEPPPEGGRPRVASAPRVAAQVVPHAEQAARLGPVDDGAMDTPVVRPVAADHAPTTPDWALPSADAVEPSVPPDPVAPEVAAAFEETNASSTAAPRRLGRRVERVSSRMIIGDDLVVPAQGSSPLPVPATAGDAEADRIVLAPREEAGDLAASPSPVNELTPPAPQVPEAKAPELPGAPPAPRPNTPPARRPPAPAPRPNTVPAPQPAEAPAAPPAVAPAEAPPAAPEVAPPPAPAPTPTPPAASTPAPVAAPAPVPAPAGSEPPVELPAPAAQPRPVPPATPLVLPTSQAPASAAAPAGAPRHGLHLLPSIPSKAPGRPLVGALLPSMLPSGAHAAAASPQSAGAPASPMASRQRPTVQAAPLASAQVADAKPKSKWHSWWPFGTREPDEVWPSKRHPLTWPWKSTHVASTPAAPSKARPASVAPAPSPQGPAPAKVAPVAAASPQAPAKVAPAPAAPSKARPAASPQAPAPAPAKVAPAPAAPSKARPAASPQAPAAAPAKVAPAPAAPAKARPAAVAPAASPQAPAPAPAKVAPAPSAQALAAAPAKTLPAHAPGKAAPAAAPARRPVYASPQVPPGSMHGVGYYQGVNTPGAPLARPQAPAPMAASPLGPVPTSYWEVPEPLASPQGSAPAPRRKWLIERLFEKFHGGEDAAGHAPATCSRPGCGCDCHGGRPAASPQAPAAAASPQGLAAGGASGQAR